MRAFQGKPMTFHESLHLCGCAGCRSEISDRMKRGPLPKPDFVSYLADRYPATADLLGGHHP